MQVEIAVDFLRIHGKRVAFHQVIGRETAPMFIAFRWMPALSIWSYKSRTWASPRSGRDFALLRADVKRNAIRFQTEIGGQ